MGLLDIDGNLLHKPTYSQISRYRTEEEIGDIVQIFSKDGIGLINLDGKEILPPKYHRIEDAGDGYFKVYHNHDKKRFTYMYSLFSPEGKQLTSFDYGEMGIFHNDFIRVSGIIDSYGADTQEVLKRLVYLSGADGTGAEYYYFIVDENQSIEDNPIVFLGTEGELDLVASNLNEFLQLVSIDTKPMGTQPDDDIISYYKDIDDEASTFLEDYIAWLKEKGLEPIVVTKELEDQDKRAEKIVRKANDTYKKVWVEFLETMGML